MLDLFLFGCEDALNDFSLMLKLIIYDLRSLFGIKETKYTLVYDKVSRKASNTNCVAFICLFMLIVRKRVARFYRCLSFSFR